MKILQIITLSELGGAQSVVVNLANRLTELGHEVIVAAGEGDGKMYGMLDNRIKVVRLVHMKRSLSIKHDFKALFELRKLGKKYKPDIVHLHSSKAGMLGRIVFDPKKIIYTVHGFDSIRLAYRKFLPLERLMQNRCKAIVGVSRYDYDNLMSCGITNGVTYILNGIKRPDTSGVSELPEMNKYEKVVLAIARVNPPKRHELFIEVSNLLPEFGFIWVGNQMPIDGCPENCHFVGNIPNAGAYCSKADLFMLPSNYEGLPIVIIEAMSFGLPIIASDVGGIKEIVRNGENGYVVDNVAEKFASYIKTVLSDKNHYDSFSQKSLDIYNQELSIEHMTARYLKIYNS